MTQFVDPTRDQFSAMMKMADDGPIHMLNMLRFRDAAAYEPGHALENAGLSGAEAYAKYGEESGPIFRRVGGRIAFRWAPKLVVIGPEDECWDAVFIAAYPNAEAFGEMVKDRDYQIAVKHRQAAVETSRLIRLKEDEAGAGFGV
ncbi:MAG: DUF1330 domain-containing protein [Pseudomonadota bacterium]